MRLPWQSLGARADAQLILVAQAANAILLPIMAFFVIFCANGKDLGKFKNHAFANIAGVIIIVVTLFILLPQHDELPHPHCKPSSACSSGSYQISGRPLFERPFISDLLNARSV